MTSVVTGYWTHIIQDTGYSFQICLFLVAFAKFRKATVSLAMSVLVEQHGSHWSDFRKILYLSIFWEVYKIRVWLLSDKINGHFTWGRCYIYDNITTISCPALWEWEMFLTKFVERVKTRILHSIPFSENHTIYETTRKNIVEMDRPHVTI
jgi:hypothetical protein